MSREKAIELLKNIEHICTPVNYKNWHCPICGHDPFTNIKYEVDCKLAKAIELLESEPEQGEFDIKEGEFDIGEVRRYANKGDVFMSKFWFRGRLLQACDRIDRLEEKIGQLQAENKKLNHEVDRLNSTEFVSFAKARINKVEQLQAEKGD